MTIIIIVRCNLRDFAVLANQQGRKNGVFFLGEANRNNHYDFALVLLHLCQPPWRPLPIKHGFFVDLQIHTYAVKMSWNIILYF